MTRASGPIQPRLKARLRNRIAPAIRAPPPTQARTRPVRSSSRPPEVTRSRTVGPDGPVVQPVTGAPGPVSVAVVGGPAVVDGATAAGAGMAAFVGASGAVPLRALGASQ